MALLNQIGAAIRLTLGSIPRRAGMSAATVCAVALAVAVVLGFLAMSEGFRRTVASSGSPDVVIVTREGANGEISSIVTGDQVARLRLMADVQRFSPETVAIVSLTKRGTGLPANVPLRGIGPDGVALRPLVRIDRGRMFRPHSDEIVVGAGLAREFAGLDIGHELRLGPARWRVVGIASAPGTVFESELWADPASVQTLFRRGRTVQSVRLSLAGAQPVQAATAFINADPQLPGLAAVSERDFFARQSESAGRLIRYIGWPLGILMSLGALAGALNTLFNSVSVRLQEIRTLRIIGFAGLPIFVGVMAEALLLSLVGGMVGLLLCILIFDGVATSTIGSDFTEVVFRFTVDAHLVTTAIVVASAIGLVGGVFPGIHAARQKPRLATA